MSLSAEEINALRASFNKDPMAKVAQNAVCNAAVKEVLLDHEVAVGITDSMSVQVDTWEVTNQKSSGRCWLFACLNLLRPSTMKKLNVKSFEFSQAHIHFWDKMERSNCFLEAILDTSNLPVDDRTVHFLLGDPIGDGGQWNMATNLIRKHGLVPKSAYPETFSSSATAHMNAPLRSLLRTSACELRKLVAGGASVEDARKHKEKRVADVWRLLCIHLGTPPENFEWQWTDKDNKFTRKGTMTPQEFAQEYVELDWNSMVCLVNDPRHPQMKTYSVDRLDNVVGGQPVKYLNISVEAMKSITQRHLEDGVCVWMGCDVGKQMHRKKGVWDLSLFNHAQLYGVDGFDMSKEDRLLHGQTMMTHAMLFTGVDVGEDGKPRKWRVENSWGTEGGVKGFYTMADNWYDEHMFEIASLPAYLTDEMRAAIELPPVVLPAWDPMGSLANEEAVQAALRGEYE
jgi:bleomycin hydrolase